MDILSILFGLLLFFAGCAALVGASAMLFGVPFGTAVGAFALAFLGGLLARVGIFVAAS